MNRFNQANLRPILAAAAAVAAAGGLALAYAVKVERSRVQLDRYTVPVDAAGLPAGGLTILHLSDFHFRAGGEVQARKIRRLLALLEHESYDVLALTGDLVHDAAGFPVALSLVEHLRPRLAAYVCPGNHDYAEYSVWGVMDHTWRAAGRAGEAGSAGRPGGLGALGPAIRRYAGIAAKLLTFARKVLRNELVRLPVTFNDVPAMLETLAARGVIPLVNRAVPLGIAGGEVWFAGVDDALEGAPDLAAALAGVPEAAPLVLLAHNPDIWLDPRVDRAHLVLSGHTHGGQIRLPLLGAVHTQGTHLRRSRPAGWFRRGRARMHVSRGLGESIPLRFAARPQAALIRLVAREG